MYGSWLVWALVLLIVVVVVVTLRNVLVLKFGALSAIPQIGKGSRELYGVRLLQNISLNSGDCDAYKVAADLADIADSLPGVFVLPGSLLSRERIIITSPSAIRKITTDDVFDKPGFVKTTLGGTFGSDSMLFAIGTKHRRLRKVAVDLIHQETLHKSAGAFFRAGRRLAETWSSAKPPVEAHIENMNTTLGVITESLFSWDIPERTRLHNLYVAMFLEEAPSPLDLLTGYILPYGPLLIGYRNARAAREVLCSVIEERRRNRNPSRADLLEQLLSALDAGMVDIDELVSQVQTLYVAGFSTTAIWLSWSMYYLASSPKWQEKVRTEIASIDNIQDDNERLSRLDSLPLLHAVTKEVLRLHPPITDTLRQNSSDVCIDGFRIPKGTLLRIPIGSVHRMERFWGTTANEFDPARHLNLNGNGSASGLWLPFLTGPHACIGGHYARLEVKAILSELVRKVSLCDPRMGICRTTLGNPSNFSLRADSL
ncbi:hypothetical protein NDN08_006832 [Rhodosorus marinus]|uniref:Cytochrome P450 n=1 Tax=Rhodosorus marinus TaxID=101924 RepID=A0AAV8UMJ7_9RHOD|nr:hypothetical protein NDN08_006832 [Rhodosorus marinus]